MAMTTLTAALLGCLAGLGALVAVAGWRGVPARRVRGSRRGRAREQLNLRLGLAVGAAVLVGAVTRWPVAMVAAALFGWTAPTLLGARARRRWEAERTEAVARWAEQLRDTMTAAAGLHEAIGVTARVAPLPIRLEVQELAARLRRMSLADAARLFAARIGNAAGDQVAVALILASERHGARLAEVLGRVAAATRAEAALHLRIEAQRARTYSQARLISGVIAAVVAVYVVLNRDYLAPFATASGQLVLALVCGLWFASLWALVRLAEARPGERLLGQVAALGPTEAGG
jgi:Flp pilus assembly protein TadB